MDVLVMSDNHALTFVPTALLYFEYNATEANQRDIQYTKSPTMYPTMPTMSPTSQSPTSDPTTEPTWARYEAEPDATFASPLGASLIPITVLCVLFVIILSSYIDAWVRHNDFYKLPGLTVAAFHFLDLIYDVLFSLELREQQKFLLFVASAIFIIIPM